MLVVTPALNNTSEFKEYKKLRSTTVDHHFILPQGLWEGEFHALVVTLDGALLCVSLSSLFSSLRHLVVWVPLNQP